MDWSLLKLFAVLFFSGVVLGGCVEDTGGPQFANEPAPTRAATRVVNVATPSLLPTAQVMATPLATPASIADLLRVRGAPSNLFLTLGANVWAIDGEGGGSDVFDAPSGAEILALDPAPAADRVAILLREVDGNEASFAVVIVNADSEIVRRFEALPPAAATPGLESLATGGIIDWSPQGDRLLVSYAGGVTATMAVDGEGRAEPLSLGGDGTSLVDVAWSPTGESVAYTTTRGDDRERALWLHDITSGETTPIVDPEGARFVVEFAWMPNGIALLFTEAEDPEGAVSGIDLWRIDADGQNRQLVASAGTVAPVARITEIHPAPDGRSVAYAVLVPGESGPRVDSVWVRDLSSRVGFKIALPTVASVDEIIWTDSGLAIAVTTTDTGREQAPTVALLKVAGEGQVSALWAAPVQSPAAQGTPIGTPVSR